MTGQRTAGTSPTPKPAAASMTLLVAGVIVHDQENNRIVLLQRGPNAVFAPGRWDLPVGKADPGEPVTRTAVRELREETGLVVDPACLRLAHLVHGAWGVEAPNGFLTVLFATHEWSGDPVNVEPHKHAQVAWVGTSALPDELVPTTGSALAHYLGGGAQVSLKGWAEIGDV